MFGLVRKLSSRLIVPAGWTFLTILLLSLPGSAIPEVNLYEIPHVDKLVHFLLFGGIPVFWSFYLIPRKGRARRIVVIACLVSIALGIVMEYIQHYFVANRDFDIIDIYADSLGAISFGVLVLLSVRRRDAIEPVPRTQSSN